MAENTEESHYVEQNKTWGELVKLFAKHFVMFKSWITFDR